MGVVDQRVYLTIDIATCVNHIEVCNTAFQGPGGDIELINVTFGHVLLGSRVTQAGVDQERTFDIDFLGHTSDQNAPLIINVVSSAYAVAVVARFVPIIFYNVRVGH